MKTNKEQTKLERAIELYGQCPEYKNGEYIKINGWKLAYYPSEFPNAHYFQIDNLEFNVADSLITKSEDLILTSLIADLERHFRTIENKYPMFNITELRREDGEEVGHGSNIFIKTEEIFRSELTGKHYKLVEVGGDK